MPKLKLVLPSVALASLASAVFADPGFECSVSTSSQIETRDCVAQTEDRVEKVLQAALGFARDAAAELDTATGRSDAVPALDTSQSAWADYRDRHCAYVGATFGGGSGTGIAISACRIDLARERIGQLMALAN